MNEIGIFAAKAGLVFLVIGLLIVLIAILVAKAAHKNELEVEPLHKKFQHLALFLNSFSANKEELKAEKKKLKKEEKEQKKKSKSGENKQHQKRVFVLNFDGDLKASAVDSLREEITAVLQTATSEDEVVVRLESPGGVVHGYGLAASQLHRLREHNIPLTACVDKIAASGGYMMAVVANKIMAAPFAIVGSIGVLAQIPNFNKILKKLDVDYKEYTAGEFKRTISLLGEITPKGEEHFVERLNDTHVLFKNHVHKFRPQLDLLKVATGDYWFGEEAKNMGLVDELKTSDDYLLSFPKGTPIFELNYEIKEKWQDKLGHIFGKAAEKTLLQLFSILEKQKFL